MEAFEDGEDLLGLSDFKAYSVILHCEIPVVTLPSHRNLNTGSLSFLAKLDRVSNEILKQLGELNRIT